MRGVNVFVHRGFPMATWRGIDDHQDTDSVWKTPGMDGLIINDGILLDEKMNVNTYYVDDKTTVDWLRQH